jgi:hypothetical protein
MPYDSRATLITRLTDVRSAITKARTAQQAGTADSNVQRANLKQLLDEEKWVLQQIAAVDASSEGGFSNRVQFGRPS